MYKDFEEYSIEELKEFIDEAEKQKGFESITKKLKQELTFRLLLK